MKTEDFFTYVKDTCTYRSFTYLLLLYKKYIFEQKEKESMEAIYNSLAHLFSNSDKPLSCLSL